MVAFRFKEDEEEGPSSHEFTTTIIEEVRAEAIRLQGEYGYPFEQASFMAATAAMAPCVGVLLGATHQPVTNAAITAHIERFLGELTSGDHADGTN